jgi:nitrite reductase/ring-hydroxylating ferredoxin subunit/uncharacterized membrane protein
MAAEPPVDVIERQEWLEPVETGLQKAVSGAYGSAGVAGQKVRNFLHGVWLGHPLHPVLTDLPIGAWSAAAVLDAMESAGHKDCARGADLAIQVGLAGAAGSAITGLTDWQATDGTARRVGVAHGLINLTSAALYTASLVARSRRNRSAGRTLAFLGFAASMAAAYLGGHLVYSKGIGVNHTDGVRLPEDWTSVLEESALRENEPRRVEANGTPIVLVRREGSIHALAEICSHLGGPLSEGEVQGDTIRCPWHASRFRLSDGSVIDGPATHPQPCLETRIQHGNIELRARPV